jgi:hypothetical protein
MKYLLALTAAALASSSSACVKGDPVSFDPTLKGGTLAIEGCGYSVTTGEGVEAPQPAAPLIGDDATPKHVHLGFIGDPKTSMVVQWRTNDDVTLAGEVRYAEGNALTPDQLTQLAPGVTFAFAAIDQDVHPRMHQGHLCGLKPNTTYSYQVGTRDPSTEADHFSPVYSFHTAPDIVANPDTEVVLASLGDCRNGYDTWQQLVTLVQTHAPDLILFSGDAVTFGNTQFEWEAFFSRAEPLFATTPMTFAHGNHEVNAAGFFAQNALPGDQQDFSFDWGWVHVTVMNDTPEDPTVISTSTKDFLSGDLANVPSTQWKIAMHHQPVFSSAVAHGSTLILQQEWQPIYDANHVDLVLNGHDHDFEMSKPMVGQTVQSSVDLGTVYLVQGGAGAELYDNAAQFYTSYTEKTFSASILHARRTMLTLDAFRPDGSSIPSSFAKTKP